MTALIRLAVIVGVFVLTVLGWAAGGYAGAALGLVFGLALLAVPWRGQPLWAWAALYLRRNRPIVLSDPVTVANDRSGGGVRYQDGVAVAAVQLLGKRYQPTYFTGSAATETANTVDVSELLPHLHQTLGLTVESMSVVSAGARRRATGDYPRVYDTLIGTPPYAGQRETWLIIRIRALDNGDALQWRSTVGTATLAAAQRIAMAMRCKGIRARVATATDIVELERRLGRTALEPHNRRWTSVRSDAGWQTTYALRPADITTEVLAQAWSLRADGVIQNLTVFPDGRASATVTVRTAQPPTAPPAVALQPLPGEQAQAIAANLCGPRPPLRRLGTAPLRRSVVIPIGPSGVLLGKTAGGDRLLLPLSDPGDQSRIHIAADDSIAKRIVIRAAAAGERVTVHSTNLTRWDTVRMPNIAVLEHPRPASGTTTSVIDGTVPPAPRPNTVISVGAPGGPIPSSADVIIVQTGRDTVDISAEGGFYEVEVEFFRAENIYIARASARREPSDYELEMVK
jgi:type VII secretion protein EccE